jgi:hypothetical protein
MTWEELNAGFETHARANEIDLADAALGPMLEIDGKNETFVGPTATPEAKALLTRRYRKPYVVPDNI